MDTQELSKIAKQMVTDGKGILAADESMPTVGKRFASINLENTEANRIAFRNMLLTAPGIGQYVSGVILFDETIRQNTLNGESFVSVLQKEGILPGIKVDQGLADFGSAGEKTTKGLEGLADRLKEYAAMGAKFTKWRSVITIGQGIPTNENIRQNAKDLARYALIVQQAGMVPMVEPEVLLEGEHSIAEAKDASAKILQALFEELKNAGVAIEGVIVKTSMVLPGNKSAKASPEEIAKETINCFIGIIPDELPGVVFLSGGQGDIEATENLNAINIEAVKQSTVTPPAIGAKKLWPLTFSYARALQDAATKVWAGKPENLAAAQKAFLHRAKMNSLASIGQYSAGLESGSTSEIGASVSQD